MKTTIYTIALFFVFATMAVAQPGKLMQQKMEQVKSMKVAFITNELALTPDEAAKFWPVYNAFDAKQQEIRRNKLKGFINRIDEEEFDNLSEKEASAMLTQIESTEEDLFQLRKKFNADLRSVIPATKILKLKKAEDEFNRKLLQQFRDRQRRR